MRNWQKFRHGHASSSGKIKTYPESSRKTVDLLRVPRLYLIILTNPVVRYLRQEKQIHIMIFYVEFNWDSQPLSNEKNTCLYRSLFPARINHYHIYRIKVFLFIQQFVLIRHLTPEKIYRFILEINLSDCPFMTGCQRQRQLCYLSGGFTF